MANKNRLDNQITAISDKLDILISEMRVLVSSVDDYVYVNSGDEEEVNDVKEVLEDMETIRTSYWDVIKIFHSDYIR